MPKANRPWRKLVKKLRRKRIRQELAKLQDVNYPNCDNQNSSEDEDESQKRIEKEEELQWLDRERKAQEDFERRKMEEQRRLEAEEAEKMRIREEWEELQAKQEEERLEKERVEEETRLKQEQDFNQFLDFLAGDSENPPLPYIMPEDPFAGEVPVCPWYSKTAACRFTPRCNKSHPKPTLSHTLLFPNFFTHISLGKTLQDDADQNLEYEDSELYREFLVFYYDVLPELKSAGEVLQFKVCCNVEPHLRGHVYVQFRTIREAVEAYRKFNGRFYDGKQLSVEFVRIESWRSAICGLFQRKRCPKPRTCNFLHVFRSPTKEFVRADNDWKGPETPRSFVNPQAPILPPTPQRVPVPPSPKPSAVPNNNNHHTPRSISCRAADDYDRRKRAYDSSDSNSLSDHRSRSKRHKSDHGHHHHHKSHRRSTSRSPKKESKKHKKHKHKHKKKKSKGRSKE